MTRGDGGLGEVDAEADDGKVKYKLTLGQDFTALQIMNLSKSTQKYKLESSCRTDRIAMLLSGRVMSKEVAEKIENIKNIKADIASHDLDGDQTNGEGGVDG